MFENIGKKIMKLAKVICWIGIIFSIIYFLAMLISGIDDDNYLMIALSFVILVTGCLISWISCFFTYGFGKLIDNTDILVKKEKNTISEEKENKQAETTYEVKDNTQIKQNKIIIEEGKKENEVKKARLGVKLLIINQLISMNYDKSKYTIPEGLDKGLYVKEVYTNSVANGILKPNDIILEFNGFILNDGSGLLSELSNITVGSNTTVNLKILRDGNEMTIQLTW